MYSAVVITGFRDVLNIGDKPGILEFIEQHNSDPNMWKIVTFYL
jgi:hypothetical protein